MSADPRPGRVPPGVREFFAAKGIEPAFSYLDVWREEHLAAFSVAKAVEADVIQAMRQGVQEALEQGLPFETFQKRVTPLLADAGWWGRASQKDPLTGETKDVQLGSPARLRLVFETNMRVTRAAGQWERMEKASKALPFLRYRLGASEKHRPDHEEVNGHIYPFGHPFWDFWYPPNGYGCKCWAEQITARRAAELGYVGAEPPAWAMEPKDFKNPRTGRVVSAPRGVDPGFAYNPGKSRLEGLKQVGILKKR